MEKQIKRKVAVLTLGIFLLSILSGCGAKEAEQQEEIATVPVEVETVALQDFDKVITLGGLTAAENTVNVIAKVSGMEQVKAVNVKVGDKVSAGQVLAQLDNETTRISYDNAQLAVSNAEASINVAQQSYSNAETNYNNALELFELGAMSQSDLDQLKLARDNAESQLNSARIGAANARNNLQSAQLALDYATVTAPISGTVTMVNADVGSYATASAPMFEIANVDVLEISTGINEQNVSKIQIGQEVLLKVNSVSDQWFSGTITEISKVMNSQTKNYPITIAMNNKDNAMVAGMYAEIQVVVDHVDDVLVIPVNAIVYKEGKPTAYVMQADNTVKEVQLTLGLNDGDYYVVTKGVNAGDRIVVTGNSSLVDGEAVTAVRIDGVEQDLIADIDDAADNEDAEDSAAQDDDSAAEKTE